MLAEVLLVVAVSVVSLALFLLTKDPEEREKDGGIGGGLKPARWSRLRIFKDGEDKAKKTRTVTVSKDTIYAMMQRDVYALNAEDVMTDDEGRPIDDGDDGRWAREQMERVAADLDSDHPNVISLNLLVKDYCDRVEMMMDDFKESLCDYNKNLAQVIENRMAVETEIKEKCNQQLAAVENDKSSHRHWKPLPVPSVRHPIVAASRADDDFLTIIEQFEKSQGKHHEQ